MHGKRAGMAAEKVDVGARHSKMRAGPCGQKAPSNMGKLSIAEVLRLRATSAVSPDPSVRRSAQDDDLSVGLEFNWLNMQETRKDRKSHSLSG